MSIEGREVKRVVMAVEDVGVAERATTAVNDTNDDNFDFDVQEVKEEEKCQVPSSEENPKGKWEENVF